MGITQRLGTIPLAIQTDASNNVGIGAAPSGSYKLEVTGTAKVSSTLLVSGASTLTGNVGIGATLSAWISTYKALQLGNTASFYAPSGEALIGNNVFVDSTDTNKYITTNFASLYRQVNGQHIFYIAPSGTAGNTISFTNAFNINNSGAATFTNNVTANGVTIGASDIRSTSNVLTLGGTSEVIRITGGNVGIGTSSPSDLLTVAGTIVSSNATANTAINPGYIQANYPGNSNTAGSAVAHLRLGDTTNSKFWMQQIDTSFQYATFYFNSSVWTKVGYQTTGGTWTNSDERRKENIELLNYGLNEVLQLIPKKFNFKIDERKIVNLGFIAQDVLPIIPEAVQTDIDDTEEYYAMNYANLVPILVKAIQELNERLNKAGL